MSSLCFPQQDCPGSCRGLCGIAGEIVIPFWQAET